MPKHDWREQQLVKERGIIKDRVFSPFQNSSFCSIIHAKYLIMLHFSMLRPSTIQKPPPHMRYFPVWNCRGSLMKGYGCFMEYTRLFYTLYILLQAIRFMPVLCIWHTPKYEKNKKVKKYCKYKVWMETKIL